jgi:hypothetical protein
LCSYYNTSFLTTTSFTLVYPTRHDNLFNATFLPTRREYVNQKGRGIQNKTCCAFIYPWFHADLSLSSPVLLKKLNCFSITMESCFTSLMGCSLICVQTGQLLKESDKESGHQKTISSLSKSLDWSHFITGSLDKSAKVRICSSFDCRKDTYGFPDIQFSMHSYGIQER